MMQAVLDESFHRCLCKFVFRPRVWPAWGKPPEKKVSVLGSRAVHQWQTKLKTAFCPCSYTCELLHPIQLSGISTLVQSNTA